MRADNTLFATDNADGSKQPRYVVSIDFDGTVQYFTSHDDIANVPSTPAVVQSVLSGISATSQTLNPDRANATIGSMSFDIVDVAFAFTDLTRTNLDSDKGLRGRTVQFFMGYKSEQNGAGILDGSSTDDNPDFDNFILFQTQIVQSVETKDGKYTIQCADIQRETKRQIFELALTYLTNSITVSATTIPVLDLSGFEGNVHGTSYTDAPSAEVIYIRIDSTKEIIRCPVSGISGNDFTGVTRGVLGTTAKAVEVDQTQASDRRPKVEEYVYLELPAVKLAYAILTGDIEGTANVLPTSWHAGVDTSFVRLSDFQNIGDDLWDTSDDTAGIVVRFDGIEKQDAKKFLETELYLLLGLFSPVYSDGQLGLKRMVPSLSDSPYSFSIDDDNAIGSGVLRHDMESVQNNLRIDWHWNGERFIRSTIIVDSSSITRHGKAQEKRLGFRGLTGTRFTEQVLRQLLTSLRDMYTGPPLRLDVNGFHLMNPLEVGDACRVDLSNIRDYSQAGTNLQRTMVIHGMTVDWLSGVKLKLFGSSERADEIPPITASQCLVDAFYPSVGTALSSVPGLLTGNVTNAGTFTLVGGADMNAAGSIWYHDAPLTISSTTTINIEGNVQIRVRGFITIDGTIDGTGQGHPAGASLFDTGQHYYWAADENIGAPGFIGNSHTHGGLLFRFPDDGGIPNWVWCTGGYFTEGLHQAFPNVVLEVLDAGSGTITGIPTDMRGGGGAAGPRAGEKTGISGRSFQRADGGAGGQGGAALCIICRGGDFGISGQITLDGDDSLEPSTFYAEQGGDYHIYGGAGGAGAPGALLWLIDGSSQTFPDIAGHFQAITGDVPAQFALPPLDNPNWCNRSLSGDGSFGSPAPQKNMAPFNSVPRISGYDQSGVNFRISFLPCDVTPEDDQDTILQPPTAVTITALSQGIILEWTNPDAGTYDYIEIHRSTDNVRGNAVLHGTSSGDSFTDTLLEQATRYYYWLRTRKDEDVSLFEPDTSTTTLSALALAGAGGNLLFDPDFDLSTAITVKFAPLDPFVDSDYERAWYAIELDENLPVTSRAASVVLNSNGVDGSGAILMKNGDPSVSPQRSTLRLRAMRRIRQNNGRFSAVFRYRTNSASVGFGDDGTNNQVLNLFFSGFEAAEGGPSVALSRTPLIQDVFFPPSLTYTDIAFEFTDVQTVEAGRFWEFALNYATANDVTSPLQEIEFDSIFVYNLDQEYVGASSTVDGKTGLVPPAQATEQGLFLQGDGSWGTPTGSGVDSFESRTGAVIALPADYADVLTVHTVLQTFRASVAGGSSIRILEGVDPSSPVDGDIWITTSDIFARINGVSESLIGGGGGDMLLGTEQNITASKNYNTNVQARFGTGNLSRIFYSGSDNFTIRMNAGVDFQLEGGSSGTELMIRGVPDLGVSLYWNGLEKFETTVDGIRVFNSIYLDEQTAANAAVATEGQFWVRDDAPGQTPMWTGDDDVDFELNAGGIADGTVTNASLRWSGSAWVEEASALIEATGRFVAESPDTTDSLEMYCNNGLAILEAIGAASGLSVRGSLGEKGLEILGDGTLEIYHNNVRKFFTDTDGINIVGDIALRDNDEIQFGDLAGGDVRMFFDGTDFNTDLGGAPDWNITGVTRMLGATMDIQVDAITATSYGGIIEANLTDKSDTEFLIAQWDFSAGLRVTNASIFGILNSAGTQRAEFEHSGNDLNITGISTTDMNIAGMRLVPAVSAAGGAGFRLLEGAAPTTPDDGDMWVTTTDIFARINGVSESLIASGGGIADGTVTDAMLRWSGSAWVEETQLRILAGGTLRVFDPTLTDILQFQESGSASIIFSNNNPIEMHPLNSGVTVVFDETETVFEGGFLKVKSGDGTTVFRISCADSGGATIGTEIGDGELTFVGGLSNRMITQPSNSLGNLSSLLIRDHGLVNRDAGFCDWRRHPTTPASDTLEASHASGGLYLKTGTATLTLTLPASTVLDFPVDGVTQIINANSTGNIVVNEGTGVTLFILDGSAKVDSAGGATIGPGGYATLWRNTATEFYMMGAGITP